jgi:hypothetical protein
MKLHILKLLSYSLFFSILFSCKKEDKTLPLKTGKYRIEYTLVHPNGTDYFEYTAYGPKQVKGGDYIFDIKLTDSTNFCEASFYTSQKTLLGITLISCPIGSTVNYKIDSYDCSKESLRISYHSYSDTVSGTIVFNLIEE